MPPINPTGKTWELINEGDAKGSTDNVIGGTPPDPSDPLSLPLINGWDTNVFSVGGGCKIADAGGLDFENVECMPMCASSTNGNFWIASRKGATGYSFHVAEFQMPTLSTDPIAENLNTATLVRSFLDVEGNSTTGRRYPNPSNSSYPIGLYEYDGSLFTINCNDYYNIGAAGFGGFYDTVLVIDDLSDLANSTVTGYKDVDCNWFGLGRFGEIPTEWQSILGHTHFCGASPVASRDNRFSIGPSFYGINLTELKNAPARATVDAPGTVVTERFSSYLGNANGVHKAVNPAYNIGSNDGTDSFDGNNVWNNTFRGTGSFIIPGTRTYMWIGGCQGVGTDPVFGQETYIKYGDRVQTNLDGETVTTPGKGYFSPYTYDWQPYYLMFDMADFVDVKNGLKQPDKVAPYSWGRIPDSYFPYMINSRLTRDGIGAIFKRAGPCSYVDSADNRIVLNQRRGWYTPGASFNYNDQPVLFTINYDISGL